MKMRAVNGLAAGILFLLWAFSSGLLPAAEIKAVPVAGNLYLLEGLDGGNVAFLVTEEGVLVVDSGTSPEESGRILAEIAKLTAKPVKYLVLTHYHGDHTFGLQSFPPETVIIGHKNLVENIRSLNEPRLREWKEKQFPERIAAQKQKVEALRKNKSADVSKEEEKLKSLESEFAGLKELRIVYPAIAYESKISIRLGSDITEVIYAGPAHTNGDSLVYWPGLKTVHMGDLLFNGSYPYIGAEAGADTARWIERIKEVSGWAAEKFIPGHGPLTDKEGLLRQSAYLSDLREAVKGAIAAGQSLDQMKKTLVLPAWKDLERKGGYPQNIEAVYNELMKK